MRVHELAKELGVGSKDLIAQIQKLGGEAKSHMSIVEADVLAKIRKPKKAETPTPKASKPAAVKTVSAPQPVKTEKPVLAKSEPKLVISAAKPVSSKPEPAKVEAAKPQPVKPPLVSSAPKVAPTVSKPTPQPIPAAIVEASPLQIQFPITVGQLASELEIRIPDLIKTLMTIGIFANVNQLLNEEIGFKVAEKLGIPIEKFSEVDEQISKLAVEAEDPTKLKLRSPVVTMMGHVDHGKTSLLDAIRKTNVAAKEKGFITQHIGAYMVEIPGKGHVTFLDTPGHEAFTAMRARGANVTDIVVLVVAADDGVMPQTIEAVNHAREAGCPIIVAINKSDLPSANPDKVMKGLQKLDLIPEEWGGKTVCMKVSAKTGTGIDELLEMLLLEAEILELKANPDCAASGTVIESHLSKGSGPVASVILQRGTLHMGDMVLCGPYVGRVRAMKNDRGKLMKEAGPSYAVELSGLSGVPEAGETFLGIEDEKTARRIAEQRLLEIREREMRGAPKHLSLENLYDRISKGNFKELKLIIKADGQGSVEALAQSLEKLSTDKCRMRVIHGAVGGINESDIMLAAASDAIIIGFHVKEDPKAQPLIEKEGVDVRYYGIIYEAVADVQKAMEGLLEPTYKEVIEGKMQIRQVFKSSKAGAIGGGTVVKGKITRQNRIRLLRNHVVVFDGKMSSLRRFKDDVREVAEGYECGILLEGFDDFQEGDLIEAYRLDKIATKL